MPGVLCLVAHPDDETILCGGTLALLSAAGVDVHVACLTRGEGGELGEPPMTTREQLGQVREAEMVCAVGKLGGKSLSFLGYVDPVVGPEDVLFAPEHDLTMLSGQVIASLKQTGASLLLTHGSNGEYGHPAHVLMHTAAMVAASSLGDARAPGDAGLLVYSFAAEFPDNPYPRLANPGDPANVVVDVADFHARKVAAAECHATQNALFVRRRSEAAGRQLSVAEVILPVEAFRRHWPAGPLAHDPFLAWLGSRASLRSPAGSA